MVFGKFGLHLPLHRQSERFAREGVPIDVSTLAGWVGAVTTALSPLVALIEAHVRRAARIHLDDTPVPVLAKGKTRTGRLWTAVRDDRPFGGPDPPAAAYFYSARPLRRACRDLAGRLRRHRAGGCLLGLRPAVRARSQARPASIEAACWAHARRKFFELADLQKAPIAIEAVARIDAIFAIERDDQRPLDPMSAVRIAAPAPARSSPSLEAWLRANRAKLSAKAQDGASRSTTCSSAGRPSSASSTTAASASPTMPPNARSGRIAVGRRNWTFAGSDAGGRRAAALYTLIETCMCGWPPRCKGFDGDFDAGSAACMCPAYISRPLPLALMRSADRVLIKLARSRRSQSPGCPDLVDRPSRHHLHQRRCTTTASFSSEAGDVPMLFDRPRHASACAQTILAILLASAAAASLIGLRAISLPIQLSEKLGSRRPHRIAERAPVTNRRRIVRSPILVIPPRRSLPPLEFCLGTRPSHAAKSRPERKPCMFGTPAMIALAVIGPTPGTVSRRAVFSSLRHVRRICASI